VIKQLGKHDTLMSPFLTVKGWSLYNTEPEELVLTENTSSEEPVALEYIDYTLGDTGSLNRDCNIALEQQSTDLAIPEEGILGSGKFFPDSEPMNEKTGHFKRLIHDQIYRAFYNRYNNPLEIFGVDNIDFPLSKNNRYLADKFLMFTIPRMIFGERIQENTVVLNDENFDDNILISDDGNGNLIARANLFSKIQDVRSFGNVYFSGSVFVCGVTGSAPSGSISLSVSSGSAILDWTDPFVDEDGFIVQKSLDGVTYSSYATTSVDVSYYVDTNVTESNTYWYRVYGFNQWGSSSYSNTASITFTPAGPPPEAPIFLMVTSGSAILDWTSGSNDTLYYNVYKSVNDEFGTYTYLTSSTTTRTIDYDLTASNTYYYKVAAVNGNGESGYSNIALLPVIPCSAVDFHPVVHEGYMNHGNGSTYRNFYGISLPFTTSAATQSISVWARSPDFDAYLTLVDSNGNILFEDDYNGWTPSGDVDNAAFEYTLSSGSYTIELSSTNNNIGRYRVIVSPGPRLETSWSVGREPFPHVIPTSECVFVNDQGTGNLIWYNYNTRQVVNTVNYSNGCQGACYSPHQDKCYAMVYRQTDSKYTASVDVFDNTGSLLAVTEQFGGFYDGGTSEITQVGDTVTLTDTSGLPDFTSTIFFGRPTVRVGDRLSFMTSPFPSVVVTEILSSTSVRVSGSGEAVSPSTFRVVPVLSPYVSGYTSYDEVNDRFVMCDYNWNNLQHAVFYNCATQALTASVLFAGINSPHYSIWMNAYSPSDNSYYFARTTYSPLIKVDATSFSSSFSPVSCEIVISQLSGSDLMMIRGASDKVSVFSPVSQSVIYTQPDLPSAGLFEGGGVGDICSNTYVATIDTQNGPSMAAMALLDRNTFLPVNYLTVNSNVPPGFAPDGWFQYGIAFNPGDSRVYSAQHSYDEDEGRLYSIRLSRVNQPLSWSVPYTSSASDTASCMFYSGSFKITSSNPDAGDWAGRAYPRYITPSTDRNIQTMVVSDNEYLLDDTTQHNRHNWFFSSDGQTRYNDYTQSYIHTWPGRNAEFCGGKYFMMSDGLVRQSIAGEAITASSMLMFDSTGSLLGSTALTHGGMDWCSDGEFIWILEHDGTNIYLEQLTGSDGTSMGVQNIYDATFTPMTVSATASFTNGIDYGFYSGKMLAVHNGGNSIIYANNVVFNSTENGNGDLITYIGGGFYAGYNLTASFADDGVSGYGGLAGGLCYCPITNTVFISAYGPSPNYQPLVIEYDLNMTLLNTYDLSSYTGSIFEIEDIKWNRTNRTLVLYSYSSTPNGQALILDPVAHTVVCEISPLDEQPLGASAGSGVGIDARTGNLFVPQRFDGDVGAYTGSVKIYSPTPLVMP
jgi:hypothetical protein